MNLLPEGDALLAMGQALGMSTDDVIGLILETRGDLAGALAIGNHLSPGMPDQPATWRVSAASTFG